MMHPSSVEDSSTPRDGPNDASAPLLEEGLNCWCKPRADRVACLIDGESYFRAVRQAILQARRTVWILGWDLDPNLRLVRGAADGEGDSDSEKKADTDDDYPTELGDLLCAVLDEREDLRIYLLLWDFAMIYALEREWIPLFTFSCRNHSRLHLRMDGRHPVGASHHQKIVLVDDAIAFVGGFDLSKWRWDTPEHAADNPNRVDSSGKPYPPYHDVQMLVSGDAAEKLGELVRERWERAARPRDAQALPVSRTGDPWPSEARAILENVEIGIARTEPEFRGRPEIREIEHLHVDAIDSARKSIYIENQYLTSHVAGEHLVRRLEEEDGPEIVIVLPYETGGWLEQTTMDVLRARLLRRLRDADRHDRLRVYYPTVPDLDEGCLSVHSKLIIVDDRFLMVGSANLSNRSMGLDTECNLAFEAQDATQRGVIVSLRNRLLAEHLGMRPERLGEVIETKGSLRAAIEALREATNSSTEEEAADSDPDAPPWKREEKSLAPLDGSVREELDRTVPDAAILDPERPIDSDALVERFLEPEQRQSAARQLLWIAGLLLILGGAVAAWRFTPLRQYIDPETIASTVEPLRHSVAGAALALAGFVVGTFVGIPLSAIIVIAALVYGPFLGATYSLAGSWIAAMASYGAGRWLGRDAARRILGDRLNALSRRFKNASLLAVIVARMTPIAPFVIVNVVAGATRLRWQAFALGSAIGMIPGTLAMTVFADSLYSAVDDPDPVSWIVVVAVVALIALGGWWLRRRTRSGDFDGS